jgi:hypothetical protein
MERLVWVDLTVGCCALVSLLYLWKAFEARVELTSRLKSMGSWQDLAFSEKMKFMRVSTIITMVGNYTQLLCNGQLAALIAISDPQKSSKVYETLAGIGCFAAWVTIISYFDRTSEAYLLVNTLRRASGQLLPYILGMVPIQLAYALLGMCWFYPSGYFLDILQTWGILQVLIYGDSVAFFMDAGYDINVFFAALYYYSYLVLFIW